jgi:NADPH:quinone reductase-like Zn-dependent oxidoreductase
MRAITIDAYQTQPHLQEMPRPQPGEGEILIRLHAAGVNPMDKWARDGAYQQFWPAEFPVVLGFDGAGVVEQAGAGVSAFRPGDAVFGQFMPQRVLHWGTYADYVVTSASGAVAPKPISLDYLEAAALPMPAQVALACLDALKIGSGETVLIVGATGGIGTYAIQMAALRGARVLATARPEAANYVTSLGAAQALDYTQGDLVSAVHALYPGGVDAVLDVATRDPAGFEHISQVLRAGGRLLTTIVTAEAPRLAEQGINAALLSWQPSAELLGRVTRLVDAGQLKVVIDHIYPLEQAVEALEQVEHGHVRGKVVLRID